MIRKHTLQLMQRQIRARVCPGCAWRPAGSESLGPETPRSCQGQCDVFQNLPELMQTAWHMDSMLGSYEQTMRRGVSAACATAAGAGDQLAEASSPLGRYREKVIEVLHALERG